MCSSGQSQGALAKRYQCVLSDLKILVRGFPHPPQNLTNVFDLKADVPSNGIRNYATVALYRYIFHILISLV